MSPVELVRCGLVCNAWKHRIQSWMTLAARGMTLAYICFEASSYYQMSAGCWLIILALKMVLLICLILGVGDNKNLCKQYKS